MRLPTLKLLDGVIDIYLPDLKYAQNDVAREYSHIKNYVDHSRAAIEEMHRQVGPLILNDEGHAERGVLVRHLSPARQHRRNLGNFVLHRIGTFRQSPREFDEPVSACSQSRKGLADFQKDFRRRI